MTRLEIALAIARGDLSPDQGSAVLAKSRTAGSDLEKGGGTSPPAGYSAVPGGAHGGYRKKVGAKWSYWYPDTTSASAAAVHHAGAAKEAHRRLQEADRRVTMHGGSRPDLYHQAVSDREAARKEHTEHTEHAAGAQKFVDKQTTTRRILDQHADDKKRKAESDKLPETPPEGHHYISERGGAKRAVQTVAEHGLYAVHGEGTKNALRGDGRNSDHSYTVTHKPSGMQIGNARTKADAIAQAKHFHEHAGDAGKDAKLGESPVGEDFKRMGAAYQKWATRSAKKSMEDWQPFSGDPAGASEQLQKGFAGFSMSEGMGVRPDAFVGVKAPQLRKGAGDTGLQGVGAGFDSRWNGGFGVGRQG